MKYRSVDSLLLKNSPHSEAKPISKCSFLQRGAVEDCVPGGLYFFSSTKFVHQEPRRKESQKDTARGLLNGGSV